ncbi:asparaginyl-tRNA synthetase [Halyomorpha halys]|uniref:asparaginyl-tRNA synthetase n=1 Tax=Halyomorpha halys TaxID=286706 RepID=UPI0006D5254F|nr:probable asparagine--tRNA ligase, mitochondrial [Halyomorpha halys]
MTPTRYLTFLNNYERCFKFLSIHCYQTRLISYRISEIKGGDNGVRTVKGWIRNIRKLKNLVFLDVNDGSSNNSLQIVVNKSDLPINASYGSSVVASGTLGLNPNNKLELVAKSFEVIGNCDVEKFPFRPKKAYTNEYVRQHLHLRFRTNRFSSLVRVRHQANLSLHDYFMKKGYLNIHTPILTSNDCEGAGEVFNVIPGNEEVLKSMGSSNLPKEEIFFNDKVYLTVSGQLHLEAAARAMGDVYTFGPTFRAENSKSRLHLSEFYMAEAECSFTSSIEDITSVTEELIKHMTSFILNNSAEDVYMCRKLFSESEDTELQQLENVMASKFTVMSYKEAAQVISNNLDKFKTPFSLNDSFTKEQELFLVKMNSYKPIFVVDWPSSLKPFYMKKIPGAENTVAAFDLLCSTVGELCGGSLREDDYNKLKSELIKNKLLEKLQWYLDLRQYGNVQTGGFGLGFERYLQVLLNVNNIKDAIPFPRWPHNCKM